MMRDMLLKRKSFTASVALIFLVFWVTGCASDFGLKKPPGQPAGETVLSSKTIDGISTKDTLDALNVVINGNHELTYTSVKQPSPPGIILYFPGTALRTERTNVAVNNDLIDHISATELIKNGPSKILISLKEDIPYQISQKDNTLIVSFKKKNIAASDVQEVMPQNDLPLAEAVADRDEIKTVGKAAGEISETELTPEVSEAVTAETKLEEMPEGKHFDSVEATNYEGGIGIHLVSDGAIKNFKQFTIENPARIVFDIPGVESPYKGQQIITLDDNKWVKRVRHFSHPDKIRVVLDTDDLYLSNYSVKPVASGLLVQVGKIDDKSVETVAAEKAANESETAVMKAIAQDDHIQQLDVPVAFQAESYTAAHQSEESDIHQNNQQHNDQEIILAQAESGNTAEVEADQTTTIEDEAVEEPAAAAETEMAEESTPTETAPEATVASAGTLAVVNQIDFSGGDNGKSTIIIGTTEPVEFSLDPVKDKTLLLKLKDTKIPGFRQRPLITTRFESAVDLITPIQTPAMANDSSIEILLRESVPHSVEQKENQILIHFEASTIPPKAVDEAKLASLQENVLDQANMMTAPATETQPAETQAEVTEMAQPEAAPAEAEPVEESAAPDFATPPAEEEMTKVPLPDEMDASLRIPTPEPDEEEGMPEGGVNFYDRDAKRYKGEKIVLDFYETDIKNVLRILRDISGKNFAIDQDVSGKVTLSFIKPVPWDQVLDLILKMNGLGRTYEGNIIRIATLSTLQKEDEARKAKISAELALRDEKVALEPLVTEYIPISYSDAKSDIKPRLDEIITPDRGKVGVDNRTNQIIITDVKDKIAQARDIVKRLDKITPQVIIEARIVEANTSFSREFGTEWGAAGGPNTRSELGGAYDYSVAMNNPIADANTVLGFNFSRISGSPLSLNARLLAMESNGQGKIISMPKIATLDNEKATIRSGVEYPQKKLDDNGNTITAYKNISISLEVTPQVTPDNRIALKINVSKNDIGQVINFEQSFIIKEARTKLLVNDGDTVVIGGVIKNNQQTSTAGVPWLSKIPVLGAAFRNNTKSDDKEELLIFITPKIVRLEEKGLL